jgi:maltose/maltodextrin transport system permease protein
VLSENTRQPVKTQALKKICTVSFSKVPPIRPIILTLVVLAVLYVDFLAYQSGNGWLGFGLLVFTGLLVYIYLSPRAYAFRYLFPGLIAFGLFVVFPLFFTVYLSFSKYSSSHLLSYQNVADLLAEDSYIVPDTPCYDFTLYRQDRGQYVLLLRDQSDQEKRFLSEPFELQPDKSAVNREPIKMTAAASTLPVEGEQLKIGQITRELLFISLRGLPFRLPTGQTVEKEGLDQFCARNRIWRRNADGSFTNHKDKSTIRPDFRRGFFVDQTGKPVGIGFRTVAGLENYGHIVTDPQIQIPFLRIFIWTVIFSAVSAFGAFAIGMLLAVVLEWKEMRLRNVYRTLLILPYAVPAVLSILIFKGMFNQEFGAVNQLLHAVFGLAPQWETNPWGARAMVLLVNLWLGYPYMMLICTGMLQSIPYSIYEASAIEGSNPITDFFQITLPLVFPPLLPVLVASFAFNFNNFSVIYLLTGGGPKMVGGGNAGVTDILVSYTYTLAFRNSENNYALASAIATLLFFLVGTLAWLNLRMSARRTIY